MQADDAAGRNSNDQWSAPESSRLPVSTNGEEADEVSRIMARLDALHVVEGTDSRLSQTQKEINEQEQLDEILALEAILGDDFIALERHENSTQTFMVSIHVEIPSCLVILKQMDDSHRLDEALAHDNKGRVRMCSLEFLPPICLAFRMPLTYPSHCQPTFVLSAQWLMKDALEKLCKHLDMLWQSQIGSVVIYSWIEWLQTNCLSYLEISDEIKLDVQQDLSILDSRVLSCQSSLDDLIPFLIRYNKNKKNDLFLNSMHMCCICFSEYLGKNFVVLPCRHFFCVGCIKQYVSINVKEGTIKSLKCMDTTCKDSIPPGVLKQLLTVSEFARWETLLLQKTLDSMADVVYCPRCELVCVEDEDHYAQCTGCLFNFCSLCRGPRHVGRECISPEARFLILKGRQDRLQGTAERTRKEQNYLNELMNLKYVQEQAKQCPHCKMAITKSEGCNKIACGNCGTYFCFRCNKAIDGYDHFREGCVLFDDEDIQRWEMAMNARQNLRHDIYPDVQVGARLRTCPNCGQENFKEGNNNHIFCWSCQRHFCALCRKMVRRSSEHYGPNKCKQHTAD